MSYTSNLLPTAPESYTLVNASINNNVLRILPNGYAEYSIPASTLQTLSDDYMMRIIASVYSDYYNPTLCFSVVATSKDSSAEVVTTDIDKLLAYPVDVNGTFEYHFSLKNDTPVSMTIRISSEYTIEIQTWQLFNEVTTTDVQQEIDEIKEQVSDANVAYYFGINASDLILGEDEAIELFTIGYRANAQAYLIFHGTLTLDINFKELLDDDVYEEYDALGTLYYYVNNTLVQTEVQRFTAATTPALVNLMSWFRNGNLTNGTFTVRLKMSDSNAQINAGSARGYITSKNFEYKDFNIEIKEEPTKLDYIEDEYFDWSGLVVVKVYESGNEENITSLCTVNPPSGALASDYANFTDDTVFSMQATVTYKELNYWGELIDYVASFNVNIGQSVPLELQIAKKPNKTSYMRGEHWDYTGIRLECLYSNGAIRSVDASKCTFDPPQGTIFDDNNDMCTITYKEGNFDELEAIFLPKLLYIVGISITQKPITRYSLGMKYDYTNLIIMATWSDKTKSDVTRYCTPDHPEGTYFMDATDLTVEFTLNMLYENDYSVLLKLVYIEARLKYFIGHPEPAYEDPNKMVYVLTSLDIDEIQRDMPSTITVPSTIALAQGTLQVRLADSNYYYNED